MKVIIGITLLLYLLPLAAIGLALSPVALIVKFAAAWAERTMELINKK